MQSDLCTRHHAEINPQLTKSDCKTTTIVNLNCLKAQYAHRSHLAFCALQDLQFFYNANCNQCLSLCIKLTAVLQTFDIVKFLLCSRTHFTPDPTLYYITVSLAAAGLRCKEVCFGRPCSMPASAWDRYAPLISFLLLSVLLAT